LDKDIQRTFFSHDSSSRSKKSSDETTRIVLFKIQQVQKSLEEGNIDGAKKEMKILLTEYAEHPDLKEYLPTYNKDKNALEDRLAIQKQQDQEKRSNIEVLVQQAQKLSDQNKFDAAIDTYQKILDIDANNEDALLGIETAESLKIQEERKEFAKEKHFQMLDRIYNEGIDKFETGEFGAAKKLFSQVTEEPRHPKSKSAKNYLSKISMQTDDKLKGQLDQAKSKLNSLTSLPDAYKELASLTKQFPQHKEAKSLFQDAQEKMEQRAKELYAEAIAQEELAGDFSTALDLYHEVLIYAPNPESTYHKKAKAKIEKLSL